MRSFEWYNLNVYHVMESWRKSSFSKNTQKHVFCALSLNISYKIHFFFGEKISIALDNYAKTMNPPSTVLGGGGTRNGLLAHSLLVLPNNVYYYELIEVLIGYEPAGLIVHNPSE